MKMADTEKPEELVDSKLQSEEPAEGAAVEAAVGVVEDEPLKTETTSLSEKEIDSPLQMEPGLLSMPCLLTELRRDSPESQPASTESEKPPSSGRACESDSSNPCMLSPSSSGHLADSDTLSSGDEDEERGGSQAQPAGAAEGGNFGSGPGGLVTMGGRKSRRVRSESDASTAKKNRCQPSGGDRQPNGRLAKVKGHRSQKHKERMRLLRQKREAAARKKYNLLQDSSTSDSDLTCESSTSSSDDDDAVSGSSKTITADIPDHKETAFAHGDPPASGPLEIKEEINIPSSDSEVEIVGVQENARCIHPRGGVIQSVSSWKHGPVPQYNSTRQPQLWTPVSPQPNWAPPPEVVDLTLDEDARRKYLL
ncbi:protein ARK2N isoform X2 [Scleropages formosus]|uniref:Arkadia (rnf111) N-terminal like PKA signaling regulator 2n n=1 Tax=Scleropages formosus TaxID=113540 RepID=A0A8C9V470_SCLFO|nr:uncharacterized protein C18orf25 homolog isoform X2 [Scleropages formosus]